MRKLLIPAAAVAALLAVAPMTATSTARRSAASHSVLTKSKVGGPNVKVNAILQASLKAGTKAVFAAGPGRSPARR